MVCLSRGDLSELGGHLRVIEKFQQGLVRRVRMAEERDPGCETLVGVSLVKEPWNMRRNRDEQAARSRRGELQAQT